MNKYIYIYSPGGLTPRAYKLVAVALPVECALATAAAPAAATAAPLLLIAAPLLE